MATQTTTGSAANYLVKWGGVATGGTIPRYDLSAQAALAGYVTFTGEFGGATVTLQGSNDGTNWFTLTDVAGNAVSTGSAAAFDFSTAAKFIRPGVSGGTGDDVDVLVSLRG